MKVRKAVITAAGFGSRFLPFVKNIPKEMVPIIDKPSIQYLVEECLEAGIEEIIIVTRDEHSLIEEYFTKPADNVKALLELQGKMERFAPVQDVLNMTNIKFVQQRPDYPYGNGSPILSAKPFLNEGEPFAMLWGDDMVMTKNGQKGAISQLIEFFESHECDAVMAVQKTPQEELSRYGVIKTKDEDFENGFGTVAGLIEKPKMEDAPSDLVSYGRQICPYRVFDFLNPEVTGKDNELWFQDANDKLSQVGKFMYKIIDGQWMTTGDPIRYLEAQINYYLQNEKLGEDTKKLLAKMTQG